MNSLASISPDLFAFLQSTDTCTISNAIETFRVRMRNEGYVHGDTHSLTPALPPVAGFAVTARMRASAPPISGSFYYKRADWWRYVASVQGPKILVVEDVDRMPGIGALFGEVHASIARALGCSGYLTNGTVRDLGALQKLGFACFAKGAVVSHSYAHIIEFGTPVDIGGLRILPGDLLQGDLNGVHSIPASVAERLPDAVKEIRNHEAELLRLCADADFSIAKLEKALEK